VCLFADLFCGWEEKHLKKTLGLTIATTPVCEPCDTSLARQAAIVARIFRGRRLQLDAAVWENVTEQLLQGEKPRAMATTEYLLAVTILPGVRDSHHSPQFASVRLCSPLFASITPIYLHFRCQGARRWNLKNALRSTWRKPD